MRDDEYDRPVFAMRDAAERVDSHPQTLRMYERLGLLRPVRAGNNARLYSEADLERVRRIQSFTAMGVNLAGVEIIFRLLERMEAMEARLQQTRGELRREVEEELTRQLRSRLREDDTR